MMMMKYEDSPKSIDKKLLCDVVLAVGVLKSKIELVIVVLKLMMIGFCVKL